MNVLLEEILANKSMAKLAKEKIKCAVGFSGVFVLLYQFVLLRWEALFIELYYLGVLVNTLSLSVITSYIFYYITIVVPYKHKITMMKLVVEQSQKKLAELLDFLFGLLTCNGSWKELDNISLATDINSRSSARRIWQEEYHGIYKTPEYSLLYNPNTLTVIGYVLNDIQKEIEGILPYGEFFDEEYLNQIKWLINTDTYKKLFGFRLNSQEQLHIDRQKPEFISGTTLLDNFFQQELSLRLFEDKDGGIFIDKIKKLINYNS